jgi:hypothetical protein
VWPIVLSDGIVIKNMSVKNAVRWLLAAWMLLATSITSSTYVHGHSGGKLSHQHDESDGTVSRSFAPAAFLGDHKNDVNLSAADVHRHGCLVFLGAVTHHAIPGESSHSHEKSPSGLETIIVVSGAQSARAVSKNLTVDHSGLVSLAVFSLGFISESKLHETLYAGLAPASPLCDRARHERSGVQLT